MTEWGADGGHVAGEAVVHDNTDDTDEQSSDLEYDLAHEAPGGAGGSHDPQPGQQPRSQVYVPTETRDYGGDYGYDLAHDVPGRR